MRKGLYLELVLRFLLFFPVIGVIIFLPAGTLDYSQAWVFTGVFLICTLALTVYLIFKDPKLLERRMRAGPGAEKETSQKIIVSLVFTFFVGTMVLPALDHRFGWSEVPTSVTILGNLLFVLSYHGFYRVLRDNSYSAATIRVESEQKVIATGPYSVIRHPMYAYALLMLLGIPLALGSWWGLTMLVPSLLSLVWRLLDEERILRASLPGYAEYTHTVRYRLVPFVW